MAFTTQTLLLLIIFNCFGFMLVSSFEYQVGETIGWVVPPQNDTKFYNDWASDERFRAGDSIRFKYKKDSVMEVTPIDYKECNSTRPNFFSNTGNTVFTLDRSGDFYFISGASGHCEKGQKMIVKVITQDQDSKSAGGKSYSGSLGPVFLSRLALGFMYLVSNFF